ncbi:MAG: hypothetical protein AB1782_18385 [Cyanobacteriota bacterium]
MVNQLPTAPATTYKGGYQYLQNINQGAIEHIPVAGKIADDRNKAMNSMLVMGAGAGLGPALGKGLNAVSGPDGALVKMAQSISNKTPGFDKWFSGLKLGEKFGKLIAPLKRPFSSDNLAKFKSGYKYGRGLNGSEVVAVDSAKSALRSARKLLDPQKMLETAKANNILKNTRASRKALEYAEKVLENSVKNPEAHAVFAAESISTAKEALKKGAEQLKNVNGTLQNINKMGVLGRTFGKTGMFLRKHLTGSMGLFNGLFAAMTVNSVIQAKKGEKFSTLMEDVLGTWVGSLGGFSIFNGILKGLQKFTAPASTATGILPTIAKVVNKVPGKTFVVPLIGAMLLSTILQKVSHKIFGKPTKEGDDKNKQKTNMDEFLNKTGWSRDQFNAVKNYQGENNLLNNQPVNNNTSDAAGKKPQTDNNNGHKGYMPKAEIPQEVLTAYDAPVQRLTGEVDTALADMAQDLQRYGIKI